MNIADELVKAYNDGYAQGRTDAQSELKLCRDELCLKCGEYKMAHKGACDGCRWKDGG